MIQQKTLPQTANASEKNKKNANAQKYSIANAQNTLSFFLQPHETQPEKKMKECFLQRFVSNIQSQLLYLKPY